MQHETPWPADARRDRLIGDWHLYQRTGGHRTSTDDLITAWYAVHRAPSPPKRYLDLGCGVGSVLLMVSHKLRPAVAHGIEAQEQSVALARRSIHELPQSQCTISVEHADLRDAQPIDDYDLVTASPPYFPLSAGVLPRDAQRRACRFEERGGVEAYLAAASQALGDDGRLYLVFQTNGCDRVLAAASSQRLECTGQAEFRMRTTRPDPFLSVFEFSKRAAKAVHHFSCAVRDDSGAWTQEYQRVRAELGVGPAGKARENKFRNARGSD